jgi:polysaccharide pyruvyl transferase WcaK-like protein
MKKAVVFYLWGKRNAGDMAICLGTISLLQDLGYKITFVSRFAGEQVDYRESKDYINDYHDAVEVEPGLFSFDREDTKFKKIMSNVKGITKLLSPKDDKQLQKLISDADIVFLNGGNLLRGNNLTDYARLAALFYPFRIAERLNKPIVCLPQSTAESNKLGINMLERKLLTFNKVFIRESNSFSVLSEKIKGVPFVKSTDACFFIKDVPKAFNRFKDKYSSIITCNNKSIALVLRSTTIGDIGEFRDSKKEIFANAIKKFVKEFEKDYTIYFVVQTKKDKEFTQYVKDQIGDHASITLIEEYDPYVIREIYRQMHFVVAMRLHAAILSMTAETPVLGYFEKEWGLKNPGIMNDVGMPWTSEGDQLVKKGRQLESKRGEHVNKIRRFIEVEKSNICGVFNQGNVE